METVKEKWEEILDRVRKEHELTDIAFKTWLKPLSVYSIEYSTVTILVPKELVGIEYVSKKYTLPIKVAVAEVTGHEYDIVFVGPKELNEEGEEKDYAEKTTLSGLNPKYTFNTFVVGKNNEFAHAAALAVAESPGEEFNPLFLYGGVGLGKTHLMHAIAHFIHESRPEMNILYVTSEEFTNQVIEAIRNGSNAVLSRFREKYRNADVLLIDDVQFIIDKKSTQEEFFHTFNSLHASRKQIVLSSDRPPKEMTILEERIKSRFEWGLMADIQAPDYETRVAILRKKMDMESYYVPSEVIDYIASNVKSNIRELEGSLNKVVALSKIEKRDISIDLAQHALSDIIVTSERKTVSADDILNEVSVYYGISVEDIKGEKRSKKFITPRKLSMYLIREMTNNTLESIGAIMGGKHHTTISYGIESLEEEMKTSTEIKEAITIIKRRLS